MTPQVEASVTQIIQEKVSLETLTQKISRLSKQNGVSEDLALRIIKCESSLKENAVHLNLNGTSDHGLWQINDVHREAMARLGLNIGDAADVLTYGFILLKEQGSQPWLASSACWSR